MSETSSLRDYLNNSETIRKKRYEIISQLGEGSFGQVYKIRYNNEEYALKVIKFSFNNMKTMREVINVIRLKHDNIINLIEYFDDHGITASEKILYLRMELCVCNLSQWFRMNPQRKYKICFIMLNEISYGLQFIHDNNIIHRDLKPLNILISKEGFCKIADFGLSAQTFSYASHTQGVGTVLYAAPEQLLGRKYDFKVDIYPLGCIFIEFFTNFNQNCEKIDALENLKNLPTPILPEEFFSRCNEGCNEKVRVRNFVIKMIEMDRHKRPSIKEIINFLTSLIINFESPESHCTGCGSLKMEELLKIVYVDCCPDTYLHGERLSIIVGLVFRTIGGHKSKLNSAIEYNYYNYCYTLEKKFGAYEPYEKTIQLVDCDKNTFVKEVNRFSLISGGQFNYLIKSATIKFMEEESSPCSEFCVATIFRSGEILELIPCYMSIYVDRKKPSISANWKSEVFVVYLQKKFIISTSDIVNIIDEIIAEANYKWRLNSDAV